MHVKESDTIYDDKPSVTVMEVFTFRQSIRDWLKAKKERVTELEKEAPTSTSTTATKDKGEKEKEKSEKEKEKGKEEEKESKDKAKTKEKEKDEKDEDEDPDPNPNKEYTLEELKVRVDHTEVLMEFIAEEFKSVEAKLARLEPRGEVPWKLLWAICVPGMLMATNHAVTGERMGFRLKRGRYHSSQQGQVFCLNGVNFHWNGDRYISMPIERHIMQYRGLRKIASLGAYPMPDKVKEELVKRAELYEKYAGTHFLVYEGSLAKRVNGKVIKMRADGRVMIDTKSFRRMSPDDDIWEGWDSDDEDSDDPNYIDYGAQGKKPHLAEEDKALTPPSVYGFSFALKEWGEMKLDGFTPVVFNKDIYDHLTIDPSHKKMIRALIQSNQSSLITDVVSGKGGGCIFVLHGPPGTGKTLTAESIAELLERPLYIISSGQLGTQAYDLEQTLRDCLQVAEQWKAVLLIDEADVFLEARSEHEMNRNALVAVFLRVLEYFQGVMILTTNRVKQFDPAFLSRISCALKYPSLDQEQRMVIWRKFLTLAGAEVEDRIVKLEPNGYTNGTLTPTNEGTKKPRISFKELKALSERSLNGRQIKNITRTAQALALSENKEFGASYVETVIKLNEDFQEDVSLFLLQAVRMLTRVFSSKMSTTICMPRKGSSGSPDIQSTISLVSSILSSWSFNPFTSRFRYSSPPSVG
ncbi:P-loop containing nucleoside triphosphate hydrolase protein [Atractiella rhizophila]|nr:P-loop containing nucleoside triphosphate hydrolase protein [Atractiella rhizophila]